MTQLETADAILNQTIEQYKPSHVFTLFSGGHDSLCATHVASRHPLFNAAVHINTGIGIEQTRAFVRETCHQFGWPLLEYRAEDNVNGKGKPDPQRYEDFVLRHGFPGPPQHHRMYARLKERPLRSLIRDHKHGRHDKIILVTGIRRQESIKRMGYVTESQQDGARIWCAPLCDWTSRDIADHMEEFSLPRNQVKDLMHISGECLCGAYANNPTERRELALWFPDVDARITALEQKAAAAGVWCRWGTKRPETYIREAQGQLAMPLCSSCTFWQSQFEEEN